MIKLNKYILRCRFCNKQTGEYQYHSDLTIADLNIADIRCSECELLNGSYKEMHDEFLRDIGNHDEFLKMMGKTEFKKQNFDIEIAKLKPKELKIK